MPGFPEDLVWEARPGTYLDPGFTWVAPFQFNGSSCWTTKAYRQRDVKCRAWSGCLYEQTHDPKDQERGTSCPEDTHLSRLQLCCHMGQVHVNKVIRFNRECYKHIRYSMIYNWPLLKNEVSECHYNLILEKSISCAFFRPYILLFGYKNMVRCIKQVQADR